MSTAYRRARLLKPDHLRPTPDAYAEHALDGVAVAIEERREAVLPFAIGLGRNVRHRAASFDLPTDGVGVITLVAVQDVTPRKLFEQDRASGAIGDLPAGEHEGKRPARSVG